MKQGRLIDADALIEANNTWPKYGVDERGRIVPWSDGLEPYIHLRDAVMTITGMPTIEERKTGKWVYGSPVTMKCNQCGFYIPDWEAHSSRFCRNCGAKMEG